MALFTGLSFELRPVIGVVNVSLLYVLPVDLLVTKLLGMGGIESGTIQLTRQTVDLTDLTSVVLHHL